MFNIRAYILFLAAMYVAHSVEMSLDGVIFNIFGGEVLLRSKRLSLRTIKRYILLNQKGFPVMPAMEYLKYLDKTGKIPDT